MVQDVTTRDPRTAAPASCIPPKGPLQRASEMQELVTCLPAAANGGKSAEGPHVPASRLLAIGVGVRSPGSGSCAPSGRLSVCDSQNKDLPMLREPYRKISTPGTSSVDLCQILYLWGSHGYRSHVAQGNLPSPPRTGASGEVRSVRVA